MNLHVNITICRICMKSETGQSLLEDEDLKEKFTYTTRLKLTEVDNMPTLICANCVKRLTIAYNLVQLAQNSDKTLKTFLLKVNNDFNLVKNNNSVNSDATAEFDDEEMLSLYVVEDYEEKPLTSKTKTGEQPHTRQYATPTDELLIKQERKQPESVKKDNDFISVSLNDNSIEFEQFLEQDEANQFEPINAAEYTPEESSKEADFHTGLESLDDYAIDDQPSEETQTQFERKSGEDGFLQEYENLFKENDSGAGETLDQNSMQNINFYETNSNLTPELQMETEVLEDEDCSISLLDEVFVPSTSKSPTPKMKLRTAKASRAQRKQMSVPRTTRFYCVKCNRDFSTKTNLNRHMVTHEGRKPYQCKDCGKGFTQNSSLSQHMYTHTGLKPFVCKICQRGFTQYKTLVFHMRRHTGEKPFPCDQCNLTFRQKDGLKAHLYRHHMITVQQGEIEMHHCSICQETTESKKALNAHMKTHLNNHKPLNEGFDVDLESEIMLEIIEGEDFAPEKDLITEQELITDSLQSGTHVVDVLTSTDDARRVKKFQCRKCFKCFAIKKNLIRHLSIHDTTLSDFYQCKKCEIGFDTNYALKLHRIRDHKEKDINIAECEDCQIEFSNDTELQQHICIMQDFYCPECPDLSFKSRKLLLEHMLDHEMNEINHVP